MADVTKRMNYFDRQFLRAADFQDEQAYELDRRRRHNRLLHAPGVADGLQVSGNVNDAFVTVSPGTAYDALGQEIVLAISEQVSVSGIAGALCYITIAYSEQASDPSADPGVTGNSTRTSEQPGLAASATLPTNPNLVLPLARIALVSGKVSGAPDNSVRNQAAAVVAPDLTLHSVTLRNDAVAASTWPQLICSAANTAAVQNGRLSLGGGAGIKQLVYDDNAHLNYNAGFGTDLVTGMNSMDLFMGRGTGSDTALNIVAPTGAWPYAGYSAKLTVLTNGNVGIGTTAPRSALEADVSAPGAVGPVLTLTNTGGQTGAGGAVDFNTFPPSSSGTYNPSSRIEAVDDGNFANDMVFSSNNPGAVNNGLIERVRITSQGSVGIGTSAPDGRLSVQGSGGATYLTVRDTATAGGGPWEILMGVDANGGIVSTMTNHDLQLRSGGNLTHVIVKTDGKVGIGTLIPGFILDVVDRIRLRGGPPGSAGLWLFTTTLNADHAFIGLATDNQVGFWGNTGAQWGLLMDTTTGNVGIGIQAAAPGQRLDVGGNVHASSFPTSSDQRFKTNVAPLTGALEKIDGIRGVVFDWNELYESLGRSTGRREIGVIAQDVEKVFPELVSTWHEEGYKAVDYGRLTAVLVEAIKELKAKNEALERRVDALEKSLGEAPSERAQNGSPAQRGRSRRAGGPE